MICSIRKTISVCCALLLCFLTVSGCSDTGNGGTDPFPFRENETERTGVLLSPGTVDLELNPEADSVQIIEDSVITNTKQIIVSVDQLQGNERIELYLYSAEGADTPIGYATLSAEKNEAVLSNLTSATSYKIGGTSSNSSQSVTLTISD